MQMRFSSFSRWLGATSPGRQSRTGRGRYRPLLEELEDRALPSTFTVSNTDDSGPGSLRAAIAAANVSPGADTIVFADGLRGTIKLTSGELAITDSVAIQGPGADALTVSGGGTSRVFNISGTGTAVIIDKVTIADGGATGDTVPNGGSGPVTLGGGILNTGSQLSLTEVVMRNNQVVGTGAELSVGGAIANVNGARLTVTDSIFIGNAAKGASFASSGAIVNDAGSSCVIDQSKFTGNQVLGSGSSGGALGNYAGSDMKVSSTVFSNNLARGADGGLGGSGGAGFGGAIDCEGFGFILSYASNQRRPLDPHRGTTCLQSQRAHTLS
jgi:hypothetical protein